MRTLLATALFASFAALPAQAIQTTTGVEGYVDYASDPLFQPATGLTIEAWVTYDDSTIPTGNYYWPTIVRQNTAPQQERYELRVDASNNNSRSLSFKVRDSANNLNSLSYTFAASQLLNWTHVAATFDGSTMRLFLNGVQVTARSTTLSEILANTGGLRVGSGDISTPGRETWNGAIDELRIWPFARDVGEIQASMNQELMSLPGKVLTFNFNGNYVETSHGLIGTSTGVVSSATGPTLTMVMPVAFNVGASTTTCARTIDTHLGSMPTVGNSVFALWATQGPRPASSGLGLAVIARRGPPAGQPPVLGVNLAFDLNAIVATIALIPPTNALGNTRLLLPIPAVPALSGVSLLGQFGYADATCGPQGFTGSDGIVFGIQ
jgi:hypothetical protein